jgi:hypothetical protein
VLKTELIGGVHGEKTLDPDGICIFRITDTETQKIKITASAGGESYSKIYSLGGLTLESET